MDANAAVGILAEAKATEKRIAEQDEEIDRRKELLKDAKELRETYIAELRHLVNRDMPLLDATGA